jgi:hypothetical protein
MHERPSALVTPSPVYTSRRDFLRRTGAGFGMLALAGLLDQQGLRAATDNDERALAPRPGHPDSREKSVIWLG